MSYSKKTLRLFYTSGTSDKEYNVHVEADPSGAGYKVYATYGRRGRARSTDVKTASPVSLASAEAIYSSVVDEKRKKGYTTDTSGTPSAGISMAAAVIVGATAPAAPVAPSVPLVGMAWLNTLDENEFDHLLDEAGIGVQELPAGERVLAQASGACVALSSGAPLTLPADVRAELGASLDEFVVDALFEPASGRFAIVDGYYAGKTASVAASCGVAAAFSSRIRAINTRVQAVSPKRVEVLLPCEDEDKFQLVCALQERGRKRLLLRAMTGGYRTGTLKRSEAGALVHEF